LQNIILVASGVEAGNAAEPPSKFFWQIWVKLN